MTLETHSKVVALIDSIKNDFILTQEEVQRIDEIKKEISYEVFKMEHRLIRAINTDRSLMYRLRLLKQKLHSYEALSDFKQRIHSAIASSGSSYNLLRQHIEEAHRKFSTYFYQEEHEKKSTKEEDKIIELNKKVNYLSDALFELSCSVCDHFQREDFSQCKGCKYNDNRKIISLEECEIQPEDLREVYE